MLTKLKHSSITFSKCFFGTLGVFSFLVFVLSFTDVPYNAYHWLGTSSPKLSGDPDIIVLLGGAGMPSPDGLIRTYYTSKAANQFKEAKVIIALPYDEQDSLHQLDLMAHELIVKGVDSLRIKYEPIGFNTRSQALNIASMHADKKAQLSVLIVTSPEHMYRSVKAFTKAGFVNVGSLPTFENPVDEAKVKDQENTKDIRVKNLALRYNMWSYLHYELLVMREYCAISYYKLKGWI